MRNRVSATRARVLGQAAAIAILAGMGAACSDAARMKEPFFTGSTANQRDIIGGAPGTQVPGQPGVTSSALPPPPGAMASNAPLGGEGTFSAAGGSVITVGPGESLDTLAIKYGVPSVEIARANGISNPGDIKPGRALVIPRRNTAAYAPPATEEIPLSAPAAAIAETSVRSGGVVHVVEPGQTLYSIARSQGVRVNDIVALNGLSSESIRIGQRLKIPAGGGATAQVASLKSEAPTPASGAPPKSLGTLTVKSTGEIVPAPVVPAPVAIVPATPAIPALPDAGGAQPTVTAAKAPDTSADPPSASGTSFRWPVRGRIISGFGAKPDGAKNDGINLAVPEGTSVKAAEAGEVIYSGNELAGYGNLVLIRHADGWVSAYAHNSAIDVKRGDKVQRGQTIGQAGMTGSVTSPQVHFELRKGAKPVNPMDYLAGT
jgi:murein DD-endopeptidase MepM/ murein hydrolase activator NlpD